MPRNRGHELGEVRTYTLLRNVCGKGSASALRRGFRAPAPTTMGVPAPRPSPTLRGLDTRQGLPALDLDSEGPCPSETSRVRASAPRHPRPAFPRWTRTRVSPLGTGGPGDDPWRNTISPPPSSPGPQRPVRCRRRGLPGRRDLHDERIGDIKDYTRRAAASCIPRYSPPRTPRNGCCDRQRLWNEVEHREDRAPSAAQPARPQPRPLPSPRTDPRAARRAGLRIRQGRIRRSWHDRRHRHPRPARTGDGTNHHAHILLTMRDIDGDGFGNKNRDWNAKTNCSNTGGNAGPTTQTAPSRRTALRRASTIAASEDQGIDREPTTHLGPNAQAHGGPRQSAPTAASRTATSKPTNDNLELRRKNSPSPKNAWPNSSGSSRPNGWSKSRRSSVPRMLPTRRRRTAPSPRAGPSSRTGATRTVSPTTRNALQNPRRRPTAGTFPPQRRAAAVHPTTPRSTGRSTPSAPGGRAEAELRSRAGKRRAGARTKAGPGTMMRSGVADQPERPNKFLRPFPTLTGSLLDIFRPGKQLRAIFRQVAWLLTTCNLPSQLRTLWRLIAREMTAPLFHHSKRPRKAKSPRPF